MYKMIVNNECIALCNEPRYVRMNENGSYVQCDQSEADGIAINSTFYPNDEVNAIRCTESEFLLEQSKRIEKAEANIIYTAMMSDINLNIGDEENG